MLLILFPRLLQGFFTAIGDVYLYKLGQRLFGSEIAYWVLLSYLTSWFVCYVATRTLSNTMEMILLIIALYYYPWPTDFLDDKTKRFPNWIYLSIAALAIIIRPTAAIVWFPLCLWHFSRAESKLRLIFLGVLPVGICATAWSVGIDRIFYGKWVFVQYNFLKMNFFGDIGAHYGSNPFYWYFVTGIPVVMGTHLIPFIFGVKKCWADKKYRCLIYLMMWTVGVYSLLSHKEFRFLLSILPIAMFFCGQAMYTCSKTTTWGSFLILGLLITNLPLALYFGMLHQRGTMDVMPYIQSLCQNTKQTNKLPSVTFLMPCHSTPYYSHLHYKTQMKFLDCSPNLKNKTDYREEADRFYRNPKKWLTTRYGEAKKQPTLLVFYSVLRPKIKSFLKEHDYQQVSKFFHTHFPDGRIGKKVLVYRKSPRMPPDFNGNF
ncbi:GPI alpha-1,2-mannosyltransferase 3-like isoform X2 [Glandiceps talaboti]